MDYWTKCSSKPHLGGIRLPTLVLNAKNDPIVGNEVLPMIQEVSKFVTLEYPAEGGHCGFLANRTKEASDFCRHAPSISVSAAADVSNFPRYVQPETELKCL